MTTRKPTHSDTSHTEEQEQKDVYRDFHDVVNMSASVLEAWLKTDESKEVGWKGQEGDDEAQESVGHQSGKRIIEILHKRKDDLTESDYAHMRKVIGYIHRHLAQRPDGDTAHTRWAYSLKNWGHDPANKD